MPGTYFKRFNSLSPKKIELQAGKRMVTLTLIFIIAYIILKLRDQKLFGIYIDYLLTPEEEEEDTETEDNKTLSPEKAEREEK